MSDETTMSNAENKLSNNNWNKILNGVLFIIGTLFIIAFVLPTILIILGSAFPQLGIKLELLETLKDGFNSSVGIISLLTGIISIILSKMSSKSLETQKSSQEEFLRKIDDKTNRLIEDIDHLREDNNIFYDNVTNMIGKSLQDPKDANEE